MKKKITIELQSIAPTQVLTTSIARDQLKSLRKMADYFLTHKSEDINAASGLAGYILKGDQITIPLGELSKPLEKWKDERDALKKYVHAVSRLYIKMVSDYTEATAARWSQHTVEIDSMWIVNQKSGDYNPPHTHNTTISGVIYLKIPPQINEDSYPSGWIGFINGRSWAPHKLDFGGCKDFLPQEGDVLIFPSWLTHLVHPFEGPGERWCIPFNVNAQPTGTFNRRLKYKKY